MVSREMMSDLSSLTNTITFHSQSIKQLKKKWADLPLLCVQVQMKYCLIM